MEENDWAGNNLQQDENKITSNMLRQRPVNTGQNYDFVPYYLRFTPLLVILSLQYLR